MIKNITASQFEQEVKQSDLPVLVDFWAGWCGPCRMMAPVLDEAAAELEGKMKVVKVNVDEEVSLAEEYEIMSIPTMLVFKSGEPVDMLVGFMPKSNLLAKLNQYI
ncbi:MAG: thioredoxin [Bacillota bacterium]|jgi:thioredoxin 1|nr:thioredoxin [Bacillota bacterium]HOC06729.1 thioredoxin [Bacillota bacterium]HQD20283.1 thioredoxin [Bacillota bacterium]